MEPNQSKPFNIELRPFPSMIRKLSLQMAEEISTLGSLPFFLFGIAVLLGLGRIGDAIILLIALVLSFTIAALIRILHFKTRPGDKGKRKPTGFFERIDASSFPSVHSSRAGITAGYLYSVIGGLFGACLGIAFVLSVMGSRVALRRHDIFDVAAGGTLGLLIFWGLHLLF